jgi:hypothetical protein
MMGAAFVVVELKGVAVEAEAEEGVGLLGGVSGVNEDKDGWVASQSERSCSMGRWFMLNVPMRTTGFCCAMASIGSSLCRLLRRKGTGRVYYGL